MTKRIKLAYICPWFSGEYKGPLFSLLNELSKKIDVVCITSRQKYIQYFNRNEKHAGKEEIINNHFKIRYFESFSPRDIIIPLNIAEILDQENPDIVQSDEFFRLTTIKSGKWAKKNSVPFIINSRMRYRAGFARNLAIWIFKQFARNITKYSKAIIATQGQESRIEFLRWFPNSSKKIYMIPNSINSNRFGIVEKKEVLNFKRKLNIPLDKKIILDVARVYPVKRIDLLIKAFNLVKQKIDCILLIAGPAEKEEMLKIKNLIKELGLIDGKDVIFSGPIKNDELGRVYASADIFVNTSATEGICFSFLEAMTFSIPIVAFDVGSNKEVIGNDLTFKFGNIVGLSNKILEILKSDKISKQYGNNLNRRLLKEFDINKNKDKLIKLYTKLKNEK